MENQPGSQKYRELEYMDTEALKELIRTDCFGEALDEACILHVLHILESRESGQPDQTQKVDEAWRRFQENYCTPEGEGRSLYDSTPPLEQPKEEVTRSRRYLRRLPRKVAVVAAVIGILLATLLVARAAGLNLWNVVVQWSEETFHFSYQGEGGSSSWMDGQEELEGTQWPEYLPTWMPEEYTVEEIQFLETYGMSISIVTFGGEGLSTVYLFVEVYEDLGQMQHMTYEKDDAPVQERKLSDGGTVYFYTNVGYKHSIYQHQNVVYSITGDIPQETVMKIYESIGEGR